MSESIFCKNCNHQIDLDSRFCHECGSKVVSQSNQKGLLTDDQLIEKIIKLIEEKKKIAYENIVEIAKKTDSADRIIARLENTGHFGIIRENDRFYIQKISSRESTENVIKLDTSKLSNLENFVKMGPIHVDHISGLMGISDAESKELVNYLVKEKYHRYRLMINGDNSFLSLK